MPTMLTRIPKDTEAAHNLLGEAICGQHSDPSWIRSQRLTNKERNDRVIQAFHLLGRVLGKEPSIPHSSEIVFEDESNK